MKSRSLRPDQLTVGPLAAYHLMERGDDTTPAKILHTGHCQVVVDTSNGGHHLPWMIDFCIAFLDTGSSVIALFPEPGALREAVLTLRPEKSAQFDVHSSAGLFARRSRRPSVMSEVIDATKAWGRLQRRLTSLPVKPEGVFFPYLDPFLARGLNPQLVEHLFRFPWSGLYMSPSWMRRRRRYRPQFQTSPAWCLRSRQCRGVGLLDEDLVERMRRFLPGKAVIALPDFLPSQSEHLTPGINDAIRRRAGSRTIIGVVGSLQSRKGISTLLRVALSFPEEPFFFVFAGAFQFAGFSPEEREMWAHAIEAPPENCHIFPEAIAREQDFVDLANTCDVFYAAYHNFPNSSNTLAWAAWLRKPLIVSEGGVMASRVERYALGLVIPQDDEVSCRDAMDTLRAEQRAGIHRHEGFDAYLEEHSKDRLRSALTQFQHLNQT